MLEGAAALPGTQSSVCCLQGSPAITGESVKVQEAACVGLGVVVFWFFCFVSSLHLFPQTSVKSLLSESVLMTLGPSLLLLRPAVSSAPLAEGRGHGWHSPQHTLAQAWQS